MGSGGSKQQQMPAPAPVIPMPDTDSPEVLAAKRKAMTDAQVRSGRASTLLSAAATPGGSDYGSGSTLGRP